MVEVLNLKGSEKVSEVLESFERRPSDRFTPTFFQSPGRISPWDSDTWNALRVGMENVHALALDALPAFSESFAEAAVLSDSTALRILTDVSEAGVVESDAVGLCGTCPSFAKLYAAGFCETQADMVFMTPHGWAFAHGRAAGYVAEVEKEEPVVPDHQGGVYVDPSKMETGKPYTFSVAGSPIIAVKKDDGEVEFYGVGSDDTA